jgi:hypothetical protein
MPIRRLLNHGQFPRASVSDGLHFLRLEQLVFKLSLLCDVADKIDDGPSVFPYRGNGNDFRQRSSPVFVMI